MIVTTTTTSKAGGSSTYLGLVSGEAILGANVFRDFFASVRDVVGGRSGPTSGCWRARATPRSRR